jgi:hypothetical protein
VRSSKLADWQLPAELDFFKYAEGGSSKRQASEQDLEYGRKKRKTSHDNKDEEDVEAEENSLSNSVSHMPKHRVTTKGSRVPEHVDSFEALSDRYGVSSRLLTNLSDNGYHHMTGIQSYGIPILLEVNLIFFMSRWKLIPSCSRVILLPYHPLVQVKPCHTFCLSWLLWVHQHPVQRTMLGMVSAQ